MSDTDTRLTDLLSLEEWAAFENEIYDRTGLEASVFNTRGIRITDNKKWANRLCPEIKATDKGQAFICAVAHMNLAEIGRQTGEPVIEECDAGLVKLVVPIIVDGEFIGAFGACGLMLEDGEVDSFLINKITDIDEEKVEALAPDVKTISRADLETLRDRIKDRIDGLIADSLKRNAKERS
jgi:ligand-binding sensor protein